jgi:hypothetical protein
MEENIKTGDLLVSRAKSPTSWFIRKITNSEWSHVGIVINETQVLDAVIGKGKRPDVNIVDLAKFKEPTTKTVWIKRLPEVTEDQAAKLIEYASSAKEKKYTKLHMALSALLPVLSLVLKLLFIATAVDYFPYINDTTNTQITFHSYFVLLLFVGLSLWGAYIAMAWSSRTNWLVKQCETVFRKTRIGNWLVDRKYDLFCSKLVIEADAKFGGDLSKVFPYAHEVWPSDITKECERLGWPVNELKN